MLIDDEGNMTIDRAADESSPFIWEDDAGVPMDLAERVFCFKVHGLPALTYYLPLDPNDSTIRYFEFGQEFAAALGNKPRQYWLEEHFEDGKVTVPLRATISATGVTA